MKNLIYKTLAMIITMLIIMSSCFVWAEEHGSFSHQDDDETITFTDVIDPRNYQQIDGMTFAHEYYLMEKAKESSFSPQFLYAVIKLESSFNHLNVSYNKDSNGNIISYDRGYFQMNSRYEEWYAELAGLETYNVFNPYNSIDMGIAGLEFYRKQAIKRGYVNELNILKYTLNSYNMGEGGYRSYIITNGTMNRAYSNIILRYTKEFNNTVRRY